MRTLEVYLSEVIRGERQGLLPLLIQIVLHPLSWVYGLFIRFRNCRFKGGAHPGIPVISVGNLVAGGTGKTPVTQWIAEQMRPQHVAILSRGYRSAAEYADGSTVLSRKGELLESAEMCGDEPYLLARNLSHASVIVGRDRVESARLSNEMGAELILLDDGMQHRRLARDIEVVVVDARSPFGNGYLLPRGTLREPKSELSRADLIVLTRVRTLAQGEQICKQIAYYSAAPVMMTRMRVKGVHMPDGNCLTHLKGLKCGIFCGIGSPKSFKEMLEELGAQIVEELVLADHDRVPTPVLEELSRKSFQKGANLLLCTQKDFVKLSPSQLRLPIGWLEMELEVVQGEQWFEQVSGQLISLT